MSDKFDLECIEDELYEYLKDGMSLADIADYYGYDRDEFIKFAESDKNAKVIVRKAYFEYKLMVKKGMNLGVSKGLSKSLGSLSDNSPGLKVEFFRGDMRKPDEIHISNLETHEKKSLAYP